MPRAEAAARQRRVRYSIANFLSCPFPRTSALSLRIDLYQSGKTPSRHEKDSEGSAGAYRLQRYGQGRHGSYRASALPPQAGKHLRTLREQGGGWLCPRSWLVARLLRRFYTGIEADKTTFTNLPDVICRMSCSACGGAHLWSARKAWLADAGWMARSASPSISLKLVA